MNRTLIIILAMTLFSAAEVRAQEAMPEEPTVQAVATATAVSATAKDGVKSLSWLEISTFSPGLKPVDDAFVARMEVTWKLKLRTFRRNAQFAALCSFDPALKAAWKKIAAECTRIIKS